MKETNTDKTGQFDHSLAGGLFFGFVCLCIWVCNRTNTRKNDWLSVLFAGQMNRWIIVQIFIYAFAEAHKYTVA